MIRQPEKHHCPPPVSRPGPDSPCVRGSGKRVCVQVAASIVLASVIFPLTSFAVDAPKCNLPANAVSISQPGAPQGATEVHIEDSVTEAKSVYGVIHLDLRNDGPAPLSELCASVHLSNNDGSPLDASVALSFRMSKRDRLTLSRRRPASSLPLRGRDIKAVRLISICGPRLIQFQLPVSCSSTPQSRRRRHQRNKGRPPKQRGVNMLRRLQASR